MTLEMEASAAIGFQTVLPAPELGLSQADWPVSMVTSLMGVRGCVRKHWTNRSSRWGGETIAAMLCGKHHSGAALVVERLRGSSEVKPHSQPDTKWLTHGVARTPPELEFRAFLASALHPESSRIKPAPIWCEERTLGGGGSRCTQGRNQLLATRTSPRGRGSSRARCLM